MKRFVCAVLLISVLGCGTQSIPVSPNVPPAVMPTPVPSPEPTPAPDPDDHKVILALWGAPWCSACHALLPKVEKELSKLDDGVRDLIDFRLYVATGQTATARPNDDVARAYVKELGLSATAYVDPWRFTLYSKYIGGSVAIPAGAVIEMDGTLIKKFAPNRLNAKEIVQYAAEQVKQ